MTKIATSEEYLAFSGTTSSSATTPMRITFSDMKITNSPSTVFYNFGAGALFVSKSLYYVVVYCDGFTVRNFQIETHLTSSGTPEYWTLLGNTKLGNGASGNSFKSDGSKFFGVVPAYMFEAVLFSINSSAFTNKPFNVKIYPLQYILSHRSMELY